MRLFIGLVSLGITISVKMVVDSETFFACWSFILHAKVPNMHRRQFIQNSLMAMTALQLKDLTELLPTGYDGVMPAMFVGHGSPMNAIEENAFSNEWERIGKQLPLPQAILCVSAHWMTNGTTVAMTDKPETIHDFYGFPEEMYRINYPAPGSPAWALTVKDTVQTVSVQEDHDWGLDHGSWSVLKKMFPEANVPVFQLSLDAKASPEQHYALARELSGLRERGLLIVGSGNIVHNLRMAQWNDSAYDWTIEFDEQVKELINKGDHQSLVAFRKLGRAADLSIPTTEHYLPMLYALGASLPGDDLFYFNEKNTMGSVSMRSFVLG